MKVTHPFALVCAAVLSLAPPPAVGQWAPAESQITSLEAPVLQPAAALRSDTLLVDGLWGTSAEAAPATRPSSSPQHPVLNIREDIWRKRLAPYAVAGAVVGGIVGHVYRVHYVETGGDIDGGVRGILVSVQWVS